jgi:enamine deaminase RidA (YjgF/YER057c/UK114 family)
MQVLLPHGWPRPKGYANGVVARGRQVFIAGMIGWDAEGVFHSDDCRTSSACCARPAGDLSTSCA